MGKKYAIRAKEAMYSISFATAGGVNVFLTKMRKLQNESLL
jgi:hypothetical protein